MLRRIRRKIIGRIRYLIREKQSHRDLIKNVDKNSLLFFYGNNYSEAGQDGIIQEILYRLKIKSGYFVEFGGWDGIHISNCRNLFEKGFKGIFIEKNKKKFKECLLNYPDNEIIAINDIVGAPKLGIKGNELINIITSRDINIEEIQVVSIDVDGPDLEIFCEMGFKPPLVILEGGTNYSPYLNKDFKVPMSFALKNNQQPFPYIYDQVFKNGYKIVCFHQDSYCVREDLVNIFEEYDQLKLYKDSWYFNTRLMREKIKDFRSANGYIKSLEKEKLGHFDPDPLGYESKKS